MILCSSCGTLNHGTAKFCKVCGTAFVASGTDILACSVCGKPLRTEAHFCSHCGKSVADSHKAQSQLCSSCGALLRPDARFCKHCGTPLARIEEGPRCPSCGESLRPGVHFCRTCGASLDTEEDRFSESALSSLSPISDKDRSGVGALLLKQMVADRYLVLEKVAEGGMGAIYKAQDQRLSNKVVALKEIAEAAIAQDEREDIIASFSREAQLLARLSHPNLVRVTDLLDEGTYHYMVMEFVVGQTLEQILNTQQGPFSEAQVLVWAKQLCDVLHYLHSQSPPIIYRDIKPSNVMIVTGSEQVKLIDFGIARFYKPGKRKDTIQFGTDGYAPPEQYGSTQTDPRADVYALGAMLHQLLSRRDPQTKLFEFPPLRQLNSSVSRRVESAVQKAVEMLPDDRHPSMVEFWQALSNEPLPSGEILAPAIDLAVPINGDAQPEIVLDNVKTMPILPLGRIPQQTAGTISRVLVIPPGNSARLTTNAPWIHVQPDTLEQTGGSIEVSVKPHTLPVGHLHLDGNWLRRWWSWHTSRLVPVEREHQGLITVQYDDNTIEQYPVSVIIQPGQITIIVGWILTIGLLMLEVTIPIGVFLVLLSSLW